MNEPAEFTQEEKDVYHRISGALNPREKCVVEMRFGLMNGRCHTMQDIADRFNLTRERIRQIETTALNKLRCANSP